MKYIIYLLIFIILGVTLSDTYRIFDCYQRERCVKRTEHNLKQMLEECYGFDTMPNIVRRQSK